MVSRKPLSERLSPSEFEQQRILLFNVMLSTNAIDVAENWIKKGYDIHKADKDGATPLLTAAASQDPEGLKLLLRNNAKVNHIDHHGMTALGHALSKNDPDITKILLDHGADIYHKHPETGQSLIDTAYNNQECHSEIIQMLEAARKEHAQKMHSGNRIHLKRRPKI